MLLVACLFLFLTALYSSFMIGLDYGVKNSSTELQAVYQDFGKQYGKQYLSQKQIVETAQTDAQKHLDAMATRLSDLQSHIMRLNALGSRLAQMADLDDFNFDVAAAPGVGGPSPETNQHSLSVPDFLQALDKLAKDIEDRGDKLAAMESVLIDGKLESQTLPQSAPVNAGWLSSHFGWRTDPISGKKEFHSGVDFAGPRGSDILAAGSGIITWSGRVSGYGNVVDIDHGNGYVTRYAHNKENLVNVGQRVERGDTIALMGSTGRSTGSHVHFEVLYNGKYVNPKKFVALNQK